MILTREKRVELNWFYKNWRSCCIFTGDWNLTKNAPLRDVAIYTEMSTEMDKTSIKEIFITKRGINVSL